jgi:hypothetical protein
MSGLHADVAPSFLATVVACHGSLALSRSVPDVTSDEAREGDVAHKVAMRAAMGEDVTQLFGVMLVEGVRVTAEMIKGGEMYAEALEGFKGNPEQTIPIRRIHTTKCYGTPDFWQYAANTKTLRITDYKFGHLYVEVFENWQLMAYAAGIIDMLVVEAGVLEFETIVEFMIVQPRCYSADTPVRTWTTTAQNLWAYINQAHAAVEDALGPDPKTKAGTHCLFCPARPMCKTAHVASTAILQYSGTVEAMAQNGHEVGLRLALINDALTMLKAVQTGLEEQALSMLRNGKVVPFFGVGYSKPRETWAKPVAEVAALGALTGKTLTKIDYAVTPKQAVALGVPRAIVDKYAYTPNGAARLERNTLTDTAKIFKK